MKKDTNKRGKRLDKNDDAISGLSQPRTIRGNRKVGLRTYIQICGVRCDTAIMSSSLSLIGRRAIISAEHDKAPLKVHLEDGTDIGLLRAKSARIKEPLTWHKLRIWKERLYWEREGRLPNTTGIHPSDPRRTRFQTEAMTEQQLFAILEGQIHAYNHVDEFKKQPTPLHFDTTRFDTLIVDNAGSNPRRPMIHTLMTSTGKLIKTIIKLTRTT